MMIAVGYAVIVVVVGDGGGYVVVAPGLWSCVSSRRWVLICCKNAHALFEFFLHSTLQKGLLVSPVGIDSPLHVLGR